MINQASKKVAAITGGAQGLGFAIAERLGRDGFSLVLCDINQQALDTAAKDLAKGGLDAKTIVTDVSDENSVAAMMRAIDDQFGRLDAVINSAGILGTINNVAPTVEDTPLELWERVLRINLTGTFLVCRGSISLMRKNGWGRIVNISSRAARVRSGDPAYSTSKIGLVGFSRHLAGEVGRYGITVNCIAPSMIPTPMTASMNKESMNASKVADIPMGRIGTTKDIAGMAAFLVSEDASFVTGTVADVNGGSFMQ